ncbi:MAG: threonine ammonia-lyase [Alphaproteobacteria bacterium]|nr:threonine ammonia-lyase [Alphaproteobacteria bacterium]
MSVSIDDIRNAAQVIAGQVHRTPAAASLTLSQVTGAQVVVKFENLQFTASFKERGALNKLRCLTAEQAARGVIAMSAGNHAQGVARHAALLGIPSTIVMPSFTPFVKVRHTRNFGARVLLEGETLSEAAAAAELRAQTENLTFVHPYDDPAIIAGQGTIALELLEDFPDLEMIIVPVGGGGLISGIAVAARALRPGIRIFGVEASLYPSMHAALRGSVTSAGGATIADGIAVKQPGRLPLQIIREHVEDILLVDETALEQAVVMFLEIEKTVAEGAGAAALAALLARPDLFRGRKVGVILSGGNIDSRLLASIIMRGLVRARRVVKLRVEITDAPGTLSRVSGLIGAAGGNIIEVYHQRLFGSVPAKSADLDLVLETRDAAHVEEILARLASEGHPARLLLD